MSHHSILHSSHSLHFTLHSQMLYTAFEFMITLSRTAASLRLTHLESPTYFYPGEVILKPSCGISSNLGSLFFFHWLYSPLGPWPLLFSFMIILQMVGLLGWVISLSQGLYLITGQHTRTRTRVHAPNIHALSGIRTHVPSFRASEDSSSLRPLVYCDRPLVSLVTWIIWGGGGSVPVHGERFSLSITSFTLFMVLFVWTQTLSVMTSVQHMLQ
jgi:hypothetical protein